MGGESFIIPSSTNSSYPKLAHRPVGQKITSIYEDRLRQFTDGGQYRNDGLMAKMDEGRASGAPHVHLSVYSVPNEERPSFEEAMKGDFKSTSTGTAFGPSWSTHWFKIRLTVPKELRHKKNLEFHWDANCEGLVWSKDGVPLQGLTGGGERVEWILPQEFRDGKEHLFFIEMACNGMFGNAGGDIIQPPNPDRFFTLQTADIVAVNQEARDLFVDFWIIGDAAREFPGDSWEKHKALKVCNSIMDAFIAGSGSQDSIVKGRKIAQEYLGEYSNSSKVYESGKEAIVYAIGHCHIDTCWLWPFDETKRKVARSWSNQCNLMDRYPEHRFTCSQAQQFKWLKQYYPALFDRVRSYVKKGQFQPIGGSWVEHDTNMPSGESLVRQFLYGQRFFEAHFGKRAETFWLPDTFGYSTQIPQICRLAGMSRFFTQKLSWNNINIFPHTTFNWVALDGSQVLCHMAPSETYTAEANFGDVKRSVTQHKSLDQDNTSLLVFGKGDGGGGPTFQHLDKLRRCRAVSDKIGLLPRVEMGHSVDDYFDQLEKKALDGRVEYTTWYGELYLELHRGTYTTQANNKRNNRKSEIMMHDIEKLASMASITNKHYKYPKRYIDDMWETILLCQFHDCLPGSSIEMCYDDTDKLYAKVFETGHRLLAEALKALGYKKHDPSNPKEQPLALNLLPWTRTSQPFPLSKNVPMKTQSGLGPVKTFSSPSSSSSQLSVTEESPGKFVLGSPRFTVHVEHGAITSLYDKFAERQILAKGGKANQFVVFDDKPLYWQAWDVEVFHLDSRKELKASSTKVGLCDNDSISVVSEYAISDKSWVRSEVSLSNSENDYNEAINISTEVEWQEDKKFLKVEFPVDVVNTEASYETQYGIIKRPTHYNTSWDTSKFEVCCHKWADLSESNYGVSILNDSKYGFATAGNLMRLSLLRAPKAPDGHADMGRHYMRYAIFPHEGPVDWRTVRKGIEFNHPMRLVSRIDDDDGTAAVSDQQQQQRDSIFNCIWLEDGTTGDITNSTADSGTQQQKKYPNRLLSPSIILDVIKRGEDDEDVSRGDLPRRRGRSVILRAYESTGGRATTNLRWHPDHLKVKEIFKTNALEDDLEKLDWKNNQVFITLRPFEVATFRLQL